MRRSVLTALTLAVSALLVMAGCIAGTSSSAPDDGRLIADVQVVPPADFPYVVHVKARIGPVERSCAGTVIGSRWVLTAGHCLVEPVINEGFRSSDVTVELSTGTEYGVDRLVFHPRYKLDDDHVRPYDLALLKLSSDVEVKPLKMAADEPGMNTTAMLGGWGCLDLKIEKNHDCQHYPNGLKTAQVSLVYTDQCGQLSDGEVCSVRPCGMAAARPGDSGGPVIVSAGKPGERLVAVISAFNPVAELSMVLPLRWIRQVSGLRATA